VPLVDERVLNELKRILGELGTRKFALRQEQVDEIVARYMSLTESVPTTDSGAYARLPTCKDPDDQKFLELALRGRADVLVTNDGALLGLSRRTPFLILAPTKFRNHVQHRTG
jgi:putative PIN family toxin of toxin-antitoxin system